MTASIVVDVPVRQAYDQWTQFEDFPRFMSAVERVEQLDEVRTRWDTEIGGVKRSFEAKITEQTPDERIRWASLDGETLAGEVRFASAPDGTLVELEMIWHPESFTERVGAALGLDDHAAQRDLQHFKDFIEGRESSTGAWRGTVSDETTDDGSRGEPV
ncbi:SRPBCC family protein [Microbacterium sp. 22242]|uniref:SRPBCC family protein n=1 Tax=Microbacterium sp. 22242 TaxID=3453896 RepID=UPI003F87FD44